MSSQDPPRVHSDSGESQGTAASSRAEISELGKSAGRAPSLEPRQHGADEPEQGRTPSRPAREYHRLLEAIRDGILVFLKDRLVYANSAAERLLSASGQGGANRQLSLNSPRSLRELAPLSLLRRLLPRSERRLVVQLLARVARGEVDHQETELSLPGALEQMVRLHLQVLPIDFDGEAALLVTLRDTTADHFMREKLSRAERMASIGSLAAGVAHEINNPLAYVTTNIAYCVERVRYIEELLAGRSIQLGSLESLRPLLTPLTQALAEAHQGTQRVATIVRDLRSLTREDEARDKPVELREVLRTAVHMAESEFRYRASLLEETAQLGSVRGNETRLVQVFLNLLINAGQAFASPDPAHNLIRLRGWVEGAQTIVEVEDNGPGIAEENLDKIFAPFFTTKAVGQGTGLGLSICHGLIYAMGGSITVRSRLGQGACFRVSLLTSEDPAAHSNRPTLSLRPAGRARILIVDDEPLILRSVARLLRDQHDVETANHGREGLELILEQGPYDLIICDLMMPEMTGMELYEEIRRRSPQVASRFVFLTGGAFTEAARAFLAQVENPKLDKPIQPTLLRSIVSGCLLG